jgi:hypothetical protein
VCTWTAPRRLDRHPALGVVALVGPGDDTKVLRLDLVSVDEPAGADLHPWSAHTDPGEPRALRIGHGAEEHQEEDILGRVYVCFLGGFASSKGKGGGEPDSSSAEPGGADAARRLCRARIRQKSRRRAATAVITHPRA